jgi:N6-L-threonylcarbamoyladenine synthase
VLAQTIDDALGESLDKSARLLGFGYPGGAVLEKFAKTGNSKAYPLPLPMLGREGEGQYSYSGLKTAFARLIENLIQKNTLSKTQLYDLAASYQDTAFNHFIRVTKKAIMKYQSQDSKCLLVGGGVAANVELRKRIRKMCKELSITPIFPYSKKLYGDNAAMVGIAAYFKYQKKEFVKPEKIDRLPDFKIDQEYY